MDAMNASVTLCGKSKYQIPNLHNGISSISPTVTEHGYGMGSWQDITSLECVLTAVLIMASAEDRYKVTTASF